MQLTDDDISIQKYRSKASDYDVSAQFTMPLRRQAIDLLQLRPGDVVLDVGAGTGLSYGLLRDAVGPTGRVQAFEQSPEMFKLAQGRVQQAEWTNVWHQLSSAEAVSLPERVDAILFNYVHDVSRTPEAVANIMRFAKPGARIAMAGVKFSPWWTEPLNLLAWVKNRPYSAKASDLWAPWNIVETYCEYFKRSATQCGMGCIAQGRIKHTAKE